MNPQFSTGNLSLPPFWTHMAAILVAALGFYASDQAFMALLPSWVPAVAHPTVALLTYLSITQVQARQPEVKP